MKSRNKILFFIFCVILINFSVYAKPWTDPTHFHLAITGPVESDVFEIWSCSQPNIQKEYETRFGGFPNIMLWKDAPRPKIPEWGVSYFDSRETFEKEKPWVKPIKIKDIKEFLFWKLENSKTGEVNYIPVTSDDDEKLIGSEGLYTVGWGTTLYIDAWSLPIDDNTAYSISVDVWDGSPPDGELIATSERTVNVVKANHETPLDDYLDKYWDNELRSDPDFCIRHLSTYPFHESVLASLYSYYSEKMNCDSLKMVTSQWLYTLENELDPFYSEITIAGKKKTGPRKLSPALRSNIMQQLQDVCGDTLLPPPWQTK